MTAMHPVLPAWLCVALTVPHCPHHIRSEPLRVRSSLTPRHQRALAAGEPIPGIAWGHMHMIMPHVLIARRFIVLPRRDALAGVYFFDSLVRRVVRAGYGLIS
jgi:hypothetical protein